MSISETVSKNARRGRPQSWRRKWADTKGSWCPDGLRCGRSRLNWTLFVTACGLAKDTLTAEEQTVLFGAAWSKLATHNGGNFPRGWASVAYEIGRYVDTLDRESEGAEILRVVVAARRDGIRWADIRSHVRAMRLGRRSGNAVALLLELSRTVDAYKLRFPATPDAVVVGAVRSLLGIVEPEVEP